MEHYSRAEWARIAEQILGERLPGRPRQDPFVGSAVQNYKIGSRLRLASGAAMHYCRAGSVGVASPYWDRGCHSQVVPETLAVIGAHAVGLYTVVINDANTAHGKDYWANGKVEIWASAGSAVFQHRRIKSSTASNGTSVTLILYYPLTNALADDDGLEICRSQYAEVDQAPADPDATSKSIACVPQMLVTAEYYFWGLTWGVCTVAAYGGAMGSAANSRQTYFHQDGTIQTEEEAGWVAGKQPAGYLLPDSSGGPQTIIFLQLDP